MALREFSGYSTSVVRFNLHDLNQTMMSFQHTFDWYEHQYKLFQVCRRLVDYAEIVSRESCLTFLKYLSCILSINGYLSALGRYNESRETNISLQFSFSFLLHEVHFPTCDA